ncbi:hypothetical protein ACWGB8_09115 [Kitasatospora sp. NPDC054939]
MAVVAGIAVGSFGVVAVQRRQREFAQAASATAVRIDTYTEPLASGP